MRKPKPTPDREPQSDERLMTMDEFKKKVGAMMRASQEERWKKKRKKSETHDSAGNS